MDWRCHISNDLAMKELRRLVGVYEGKEVFPELGPVDLPREGRELNLDDFSDRYLAPLAMDLYAQRNRGLDHPEWV